MVPFARRWGPRIGAITALAAAVVLAVYPPLDEVGERTKGGPSLVVVVGAPQGTATVYPGDVLHPGDQIRFVVTSTREAMVTVFGLDEAGTVSRFASSSGPLLGEGVVLPGAVELDDTLGEERLFAFFCEPVLDEAVLRRAIVDAASTGTDPEVEGCRLARATLEKRAR